MVLIGVIKIQKLHYLLAACVIQICCIKCIITLLFFLQIFIYEEKKKTTSCYYFRLDPYLKLCHI